MSVQIGENRVYRFQDLVAGEVVDLGRVEHGWNSFRFFGIRLETPGRHHKLKNGGASCSGGFAAEADKDFQVVFAEEAGGLRCLVR